MSRTHLALPLVLLVLAGRASTLGDAPKVVAGRTIDDYAAELSDPDRVVRLRAVKSLGAFGDAAGESLRKSLDHEDAAVRYLAAEQLGQIGGDPLHRSQSRLSELALDETSLSVRLAASFALCRDGQVDLHLPLLVKTLDDPQRGMACSAATLIGKIGPSAKAAIKPLEAVYEKNRPGAKGGDYHLGGAARNALRSVRDERD